MDPETLFKLINELIVSVAQLLWPIVVLVFTWVFRKDITALLARLRKGKFFGQELELAPAINELRDSLAQTEKELLPALLDEAIIRIEPMTPLGVTDIRKSRTEDDVDRVLKLSAPYPEVALVQLSDLIERDIQTILGSLGHVAVNMNTSLPQAIEFLSKLDLLPKHAIGSLRIFWTLRDKMLRSGEEVSDNEIITVLDFGLTLLKAIRAIPHEMNEVYHPGVAIYSDPECTQLIPDAVGLILETTSAGGGIVKKRIFPTTRKGYYQKGKRVTWEWNRTRGWDAAWYKDPDTQETKSAWLESFEFAGRHVDEILLSSGVGRG